MNPRIARMTGPRAVALAALLVVAVASEAAAQFAGFPPRQPSVCDSFVSIRKEAEQGMAALQAANQRKAPREEFCQIFTRLSVATSKMSKFMEQNKSVCRVPDEAIQHARADYVKIMGFRKQACAQNAAPAGPSLSDVLGAPLLPDSTSNKQDGIFNTLTGNPLTR